MTQEETIKHQYKNRIITELFNSGIIQKKAISAACRNRLLHTARIHQDVFSEVMLHMSKLKANDVIECYEDEKNGGITPTSRLVRLATRIMSLQGFATSDYPKQSVMTNIMYASVFNPRNVSTSGFSTNIAEYEPKEHFENLIKADEKDFLVQLWELIKEQLSQEENEFLEKLFTEKKKRGKYEKKILDKLDAIKAHIRKIVEDSKIKNINGTYKKTFQRHREGSASVGEIHEEQQQDQL